LWKPSAICGQHSDATWTTLLVLRFVKMYTQTIVIARSRATKQSLSRKRLKIASLSLAMTIKYVNLFMKRTTGEQTGKRKSVGVNLARLPSRLPLITQGWLLKTSYFFTPAYKRGSNSAALL
jgi:hypothetical protein